MMIDTPKHPKNRQDGQEKLPKREIRQASNLWKGLRTNSSIIMARAKEISQHRNVAANQRVNRGIKAKLVRAVDTTDFSPTNAMTVD